MMNFLPQIVGGAAIGIAAALLLLVRGNILGMSGILSELLKGQWGQHLWRVLFVVGMVLAAWLMPQHAFHPIALNWGMVIVSGFLVGLGAAIGSGCTSGHAVCGMANLSKRSIAATATFMTVAFITVYVVRHVWGAR